MRYVPNVAKRSIWDQCKKYILRTDQRPATDRPPTDDRLTTSYLGNFKWPYLREGSSDPLHVWFYVGVFEVGGSNGAISGFAKSKMVARPPSWKIQIAISPRIQMAISPQRIVRFTECLVLGWSFRGRRIEWRYFRFRQIQDGGSAAILENLNGDISAADRPIYSVFGSRMEFSGSVDRMALIPVWPKPNSIAMWEKTMREE